MVRRTLAPTRPSYERRCVSPRTPLGGQVCAALANDPRVRAGVHRLPGLEVNVDLSLRLFWTRRSGHGNIQGRLTHLSHATFSRFEKVREVAHQNRVRDSYPHGRKNACCDYRHISLLPIDQDGVTSIHSVLNAAPVWSPCRRAGRAEDKAPANGVLLSFGEEAQQTLDRPVHSRLSRLLPECPVRNGRTTGVVPICGWTIQSWTQRAHEHLRSGSPKAGHRRTPSRSQCVPRPRLPRGQGMASSTSGRSRPGRRAK